MDNRRHGNRRLRGGGRRCRGAGLCPGPGSGRPRGAGAGGRVRHRHGHQRPQQRSHPRRALLPAGLAQGPPVRAGPRPALRLLRRAPCGPPALRQAGGGQRPRGGARPAGAAGSGPSQRGGRSAVAGQRRGAGPGAGLGRPCRAAVAVHRHRGQPRPDAGPVGRRRGGRRHPGAAHAAGGGASRCRGPGAADRRPRPDAPAHAAADQCRGPAGLPGGGPGAGPGFPMCRARTTPREPTSA